MKTIGLKPFYGKIFEHNKIFSINNGNNIFLNFNKNLKKEGIEIYTLDEIKDREIDKYVYCEIPYPWEYNIWKQIFKNKGKNILFCFDSPIVTPFSHIKSLHKFFDKIYTWDDKIIDNKKYFKLYVPQASSDINAKTVAFNQKKFIALINSNKSSPFIFKLIAKYKKDLYKERLKAIDFFERKYVNLLDLYGTGWGNKLKTYKGVIPSRRKIETLSKYKFCICFENAAAPGYITEKIFDCFKARCIPIYWGAVNIEKYVNKNCFIDFREFMDYEKLLKYLTEMPQERYNKYLENIEKYMNDPKTKYRWFEEGFKDTFIEAIK